MTIAATQVKELRERTGLGFMECKKALTEANGDIDAAIEILRVKSGLKAAKAASRGANEGAVAHAVTAHQAALVLVNCETDFVARGEPFLAFAQEVAMVAAEKGLEIDGLKEAMETSRQKLVGEIGENIQLSAVTLLPIKDGKVGAVYAHPGNRMQACCVLQGGDENLARDIAMHIAASNPIAIDQTDIPSSVIDAERSVHEQVAADSGKPEDVQRAMVEGKLRKFAKERCLVAQPFVKNPDITVGDLIKQSGASIDAMARLEISSGS